MVRGKSSSASPHASKLSFILYLFHTYHCSTYLLEHCCILSLHYSKTAISQWSTVSSLNKTPAFKNLHHLFHCHHFLLFTKLVQPLLNWHHSLLLLSICSYCFLGWAALPLWFWMSKLHWPLKKKIAFITSMELFLTIPTINNFLLIGVLLSLKILSYHFSS